MAKQYEIVNPSDRCTLEAEDEKVAIAAVLLLGEGSFGLTAEDGSQACPLFLFGDADEWLAEHGLGDLDGFIVEHRREIADCLDSCMYGDFADRRAYQRGLDMADTDEKREAWKTGWNEGRRSSMNHIVQAAAAMASRIRRTAEAEARV